jgi:hypothetical protein
MHTKRTGEEEEEWAAESRAVRWRAHNKRWHKREVEAGLGGLRGEVMGRSFCFQAKDLLTRAYDTRRLTLPDSDGHKEKREAEEQRVWAAAVRLSSVRQSRTIALEQAIRRFRVGRRRSAHHTLTPAAAQRDTHSVRSAARNSKGRSRRQRQRHHHSFGLKLQRRCRSGAGEVWRFGVMSI